MILRYLKIPALLVAGLILLPCCTSKRSDIDFVRGVHDMPDLDGRMTSVLSGSLQDLSMSTLSSEDYLLRYNSQTEVITAVESCKADYCLIDTCCVIGAHMEERGLELVFMSDIVSGPYGFGFSRNNQELHSEFNAFLSSLIDSGDLKAIIDKWTKGDVESVVMPDIPMNPDGDVITVGTSPMFPFSFVQQGKNAGIEIELLEMFAARTGRRIVFETIDFSGLIAALSTGRIDIIAAAMTITEERSRQVLFSDSYYFCRTACYCRARGAQKIEKPFISKIKDSFYNNLIAENRWKLIVDGFYETLIISLFSILFGSLFGCFVCWMRMSRRKLLRGTAIVYVDIIRGVPILVLLMLMYYVVFASSTLSPRVVAIIAFSMNFGAYVSEMYRTGIEGVEIGQTEAGLAMGFSQLRTFFYFVVPQAAKKVLPVFKGEAISLFKNTSVVGFIAIQDLTKASEIIRSRTFDAFFPLVIISIIYFLLAWLFAKLLGNLARKIA